MSNKHMTLAQRKEMSGFDASPNAGRLAEPISSKIQIILIPRGHEHRELLHYLSDYLVVSMERE